MRIRKASEKDIPDILCLYRELSDKTLSAEDALSIFRRMASYPDYSVYVAETDGNIIGTFALAIMDNLAHAGARSGLLEDVVVTADQQGKGIGKQMMRFALDVCREKGCYKVALSSNKRRVDAHRFYESLGFTLHGYSFSSEYNNSDKDSL